MWAWLKQLLGIGAGAEDKVKNFDDVTTDEEIEEYRKQGKQPIPTEKIVGSVGRAHELDQNFRYRKRGITGRYTSIADAMREGKPMEPIKVVKVKRERAKTEYYVVDGHHRVAEAKKRGLDEMNADITEAVIKPDDDAEK